MCVTYTHMYFKYHAILHTFSTSHSYSPVYSLTFDSYDADNYGDHDVDMDTRSAAAAAVADHVCVVVAAVAVEDDGYVCVVAAAAYVCAAFVAYAEHVWFVAADDDECDENVAE